MILASSLAALPLKADNIITNGGFENGARGWWGGGLKTGGVAETNPAEGAKSLKITGNFVCQDKIPVIGGQTYAISMQIRSEDAPEGSIYVQLSFRGEGIGPGWHGPARVKLGDRTEKALFVTGGTHDWKTFSTSVAVPSGASQMLVYLRKAGGTPGAAHYDDVKGTAAPAE